MVIIRPRAMFLPVFQKNLLLPLFCLLFILMIYLMVFSVSQYCFPMITHLLQCIILIKQQMF